LFAKLFTTEDRGQLLVVRQTNPDGDPEMRVYCEPEGLGVCSVALSWDDDDKGWDLQESCFERYTEELARKLTDNIFQQAAEMFGQNKQI
jgi:hypothetical protein